MRPGCCCPTRSSSRRPTGANYILKAYIAVVIGGWGSIPGAVAGALLIAAFEVLYPEPAAADPRLLAHALPATRVLADHVDDRAGCRRAADPGRPAAGLVRRSGPPRGHDARAAVARGGSRCCCGVAYADVRARAAACVDYTLRVLSVAGIYAICWRSATSFIFGHAGALALAQGTFMGVGAYVSGILARALRHPVRRGAAGQRRCAGAACAARRHSSAAAADALFRACDVDHRADRAAGRDAVGKRDRRRQRHRRRAAGCRCSALAIRKGWPTLALVWSWSRSAARSRGRATRGRLGAAFALMRTHPSRRRARSASTPAWLRLVASCSAPLMPGLPARSTCTPFGVLSPDVLGFPVMVTLPDDRRGRQPAARRRRDRGRGADHRIAGMGPLPARRLPARLRLHPAAGGRRPTRRPGRDGGTAAARFWTAVDQCRFAARRPWLPRRLGTPEAGELLQVDRPEPPLRRRDARWTTFRSPCTPARCSD